MADVIVGADGARPQQVRSARPNAVTAAKRGRFLDVLAATANVRRAAAAADVHATALYKLRSRDARFAEAWSRALADALVRLEGDVLARALGEHGDVDRNGEATPVGDAERAGRAGEMDVDLAVNLLKRRDTLASRGLARDQVAQCRRLSVEEVERQLLARLDALARRAGRA